VHMLSDMTCCGPSAAGARLTGQSSATASASASARVRARVSGNAGDAPRVIGCVLLKVSSKLAEIRRSPFGKCREGFLELRGFELPYEVPGFLSHACQ
jgi:hypothetical protein